MERSERPFSLVLWGASGFTGRLVAEYLAESAPADLAWAIAGRNQAKLEDLRVELAALDPALAELPILIGDSDDRPSLDALAGSTRVVCTTVGPYARYGDKLVAACVAAGTHSCDLTGEPPWIRRMIDAHRGAAQESGARIVHCCGFDSIPSDLGTFMIGEAFKERGARLEEVRALVGRNKGGVSGGTVASMIQVLEDAAEDKAVRRLLADPYALNPEGQRSGPDGADQTFIGYDEDLRSWTAPFVMAAINSRVVRRSQALRGYPYGEGLRYSEAMSTGPGARGWARAAAVVGGLGGALLGLKWGPSKRMILKRLPAPSEGPSREEREAGFFEMHIIGKGKDAEGQPLTLKGRVAGTKDPGYGETAKMLSESALCLALEEDKLPQRAGVLTPASAMGAVLLERLRKAGMVFAVEEP